jgi:hypothetical protein
MAPTITGIVVYSAMLSWTCLSLTPAHLKNGVFALISPTHQELEVCMLGWLFTFAPGLLEVLNSQTPPTIAYFKSLPLQTVRLWARYVLVPENAGSRPKIYIGCDTESRSGISTPSVQQRTEHTKVCPGRSRRWIYNFSPRTALLVTTPSYF